MSRRFGCDTTFSDISVPAYRDANVTFVGRYCIGGNWKKTSRNEVERLLQGGLDLILFYETSADFMLQGKERGKRAADDCLKFENTILKDLGLHPGVFFHTVDIDVVRNSQMGLVEDYLLGAASVYGLNRNGVYGEYDVIEACEPHFAVKSCQTVAWSGGKQSPKADLYQVGHMAVGGKDCDRDWAYPDARGYFGQFTKNVLTHPTTHPIPIPPESWDETHLMHLAAVSRHPARGTLAELHLWILWLKYFRGLLGYLNTGGTVTAHERHVLVFAKHGLGVSL